MLSQMELIAAQVLNRPADAAEPFCADDGRQRKRAE